MLPHNIIAMAKTHHSYRHHCSHQRSLCLLLILTIMLSLSWAHSVTHGTTGALRRRGSGSAVKQSVEDSSDKLQSIPDQLALAASRSDGRSYTRRGLTTRNKDANGGKDFGYSQVELNLIRPEKESHSHSHTKLSTHYGANSLSTTTAATAPAAASIRLGASLTMNDEQSLLDDSETAAEYVANAMKLAYGTQHKEQHLSPHTVATSPSSSSTQRPFSTSTEHHHNSYPIHIIPAEHERDHSRGSLLELQIQEELQKQLAQQQALLLAEQQQHQEHQKQHQQQQQQQQHQQQPQQHQQQPQQQPQQEQQHQTEELPAPAPVYEKEPVTRSYNLYESTSQQSQSGEQNGSSDIERNYLTKYYNYPYPPPHLYRNIEAEAEEKVRLSASTEIPKSEIMKQIEKSVIKYMKELEAEGKILSTPQEQSAASSSSASSSSPPPLTKTYYKPISSSLSSAAASSEEKRYSSSTIRPKILNQGQRQQQQQPHQHQHQQYHHVQHSQQHTVHAPHASHVIHQHPAGYHQQLSKKPQQQHPPHPQQYQSETETAYQAPEIPVDELSPNVEFIYKIKTRAPLQTATVKTVSKPYTLPLKSSEHFDHGAALKNIEEFDLSHVVTTPERIEDDQRVTSKPQKLYFNSEIYHDINSLPYKGEKLRQEHQLQQHHLQHQEYRHKLKAASDSHSDYKGYTGYFAEPEPEFDRERERERERDLVKSSSESLHDDGYPLINPYQYVLKKEPKYHEDLHGERDSLWDQPLRLTKHSAAGGIYKSPTGSNLEHDSYSPKFNNNPEGYGYQHTYKSQTLRAVGGGGGGSGGGGGVSGSGGASIGSASAGKRGKRGGVPPPVGAQGKKRVRTVTTSPGIVSGKLVKDMEANLALRPPPKN